ncbi:hypothetical protein COU58_00575 [Candidatus Pacearchaeota archaeon CG10_big_fil_rev_8_21_14_0_10_32_42]|nr:MAG: hypothetical protein COU58_00575 [Candidatus Pacearchaeota archaeon CG10_big_fil_rev_8_21_14_0_10_32_42]
MAEEIWYSIEPHSEKIDLSNKSKPVGYLLDKNYAEKFTRKMWHEFGEVHKTKELKDLEFKVYDKDGKLLALFEFEKHKEKYEKYLSTKKLF